MNYSIYYVVFAFLTSFGAQAAPARLLPPTDAVSITVAPPYVAPGVIYRGPVNQSYPNAAYYPDNERAGSRPIQTFPQTSNPGTNGQDPGSNQSGSKESDCQMGAAAKTILAVAAGAGCSAVDSVEGGQGSGGRSACGSELPKPGSPAGALYSQPNREPDFKGAQVSVPKKSADCSSVGCSIYAATGFQPFGGPLTECPNTNAWLEKAKGSQCFQQVQGKEYKIGDYVVGPGEGGGQGHAAFVCDQKSGSSVAINFFGPLNSLVSSFFLVAFPEIANAIGRGVKPTSDVNAVVLCESRSTKAGWKQFGGQGLLNSKLQGPQARILRPYLKSEKPNCYGQPKPIQNADSVKQCRTIPKIANT